MENRTLALILFFYFFLVVRVDAQTSELKSVGLELQAYPAGAIFSIRSDFSFSDHITGNSRVGINLARRRDLGEHDEERGWGFGFSLGSRYFFKEGYQGLFLGLRVDLWFMDIDWTTTTSDPEEIGSTDIIVLQPLAEGGYAFVLNSGNWVITPKISLGYEINVKTDGEDVGEGAISLIGVSVSRRF